ncbi:MAG TPA: phage baseplate assembly protein V [Myxococcaceae bacterium]|nr:phage baseplate assembly protein V [Myxococcaceae bacterium]
MTLAGLPALEVRLGGTPLPASALASVERVRVRQALSLPAQCELVLADPRGALAREGVAPGTPLEIHAGPRDLPLLFEGEVTAVEFAYGPRRDLRLRIRGYDLLHRLRERRPVRAHAGVSALELARELTADLGVEVDAAGPAPAWKHRVQHGQTDLELLADLAARSGLYLALRGHTLHLATLEGLGDALPLAYGESLLEAEVELNARGALRTVRGAGWNARDPAPHTATATAARSGRTAAASLSPSSAERTIPDVSAEVDAHVEGQAQALLDAGAAHEVVFRGVASGDPRLRPLAKVDLGGLAPSLAGTYVLTEATHTIDAERGFLSELSTAPPPLHPQPTGAGVALGTVTQVDDRTGRVRVRLPAHADVETDLLPICTLGAGGKKGLTLVPDVGDSVLLLYTHGDPAESIVLGGLYGADGPPDAGVESGRVQRFSLQSRAGHRVVLDDARKTLRLEDPTGSFLQLGPDGVQLHAAVPLTVEAPGKGIVIRGDAVDFERK